ncbi:MAG: translation initiation factor IF-3 [Chloroflexi bacterium AL-W]|nr:translation initiation factor IF-3 [Chloroflexi bacterium AL-N1]NOK68618.1 translation initiation factor IF-3 [Chloroflexi bacterium AL-N10]NOK76104.1 translation initiation factor IF-3 [Chloroflexi bacterium AL-N5]NOK82577.1 translation initiation factor IF-3 [Chloroflexi bacterium AL-W]NOK93375.1 translation initiation factor IF-3 [Chloroflexi bacterium AL-N15]
MVGLCVVYNHKRSAAIRDQQRINNRIRAREVRLIDENGQQLGIVPIREALQMSDDRGLDLVEVAPNANPPVCRVMDYGKFRYEQTKKEREARKHQKQVELKQIRLEPKTDSHDLDVKAKKARRFLMDGNKVKFNLRFRGREIFHPEIGRDMLEQMAETLRDVAMIEQRPTMEGRQLSLLLAPSTKAKTQQRAQQRQKQQAPSAEVKVTEPEQQAPSAEAQVTEPEQQAPDTKAKVAPPKTSETEPKVSETPTDKED